MMDGVLQWGAAAGMSAQSVGVIADVLPAPLAFGQELAGGITGGLVVHLPDSRFWPAHFRHGEDPCQQGVAIQVRDRDSACS